MRSRPASNSTSEPARPYRLKLAREATRVAVQKWYALCVTGDEAEIDIAHSAGGHEPGFEAWRWKPMQSLPSFVAPFKRAVYYWMVEEFAPLAQA